MKLNKRGYLTSLHILLSIVKGFNWNIGLKKGSVNFPECMSILLFGRSSPFTIFFTSELVDIILRPRKTNKLEDPAYSPSVSTVGARDRP